MVAKMEGAERRKPFLYKLFTTPNVFGYLKEETCQP